MDLMPAAGFKLTNPWDDRYLSQRHSRPVTLPPAPRPEPARLPPATAQFPCDPLLPSERLPARPLLQSRAVAGKAPHAEHHIPGFAGHQPMWDLVDFNERQLEKATLTLADLKSDAALRAESRTREAAPFKPSRRRFEVTDNFSKKAGASDLKYVQTTGLFIPLESRRRDPYPATERPVPKGDTLTLAEAGWTDPLLEKAHERRDRPTLTGSITRRPGPEPWPLHTPGYQGHTSPYHRPCGLSPANTTLVERSFG